MSRLSFLIALVSTLAAYSQAFVPLASSAQSSSLSMAPKFVNGQWEAQGPEDGPGAGYPVINTFVKHGPKPAFTRVFQPADYEQAVLKFMAGDKVDRQTAMGNMDAYLRNPADWAFERMEAQKKGVTYDYVTVRAQDVALVLSWSALVGGFGGRAIYSLATGVSFYGFISVH